MSIPVNYAQCSTLPVISMWVQVSEIDFFKNILLIDDAIGSGATINETSRKIREQNICSSQLVGLAITGSFKGFDVISEV